MNRLPPNWKPSRTMLAAYADGEFEGRDHLAEMKKEIEAFLADHPEAAAELAEYRRLRNLWHDTTPANPSPATWNAVWGRVRDGSVAAKQKKAVAQRWWIPYMSAAAAVALVATAVVWYASPAVDQKRSTPQILNAKTQTDTAKPEIEPFPVASMEEVEILSVDGEDVATLIVGTLPVEGSLEPAEAGDVTDIRIPFEESDVVFVNDPNKRPMIIAQID